VVTTTASNPTERCHPDAERSEAEGSASPSETPASAVIHPERFSRACHPERSEGSAFVLCVTADFVARSYDDGMPEGAYCTCIMASRSRTLYIGVTGNLHQRVFEHKWKERDGFTARYNCDRLVWFENFQ
jgi:hypothetical protein